MKKDEVKVAIYTRVSTKDQARLGHSLEEQERRLIKKAEGNEYKIYKVYTDSGISGKNTEDRPAFLQMMKDMKAKKFSLIYTFKIDRLSRNMLDFEKLLNETIKYNCGIDLLDDRIDTSGASGLLMARMLGMFAQFERDRTLERTNIGVESASSKGHIGGNPPFGYAKNYNKSKRYIIDKENSKIVKYIYDLCLKGNSYYDISNIMKNEYPNVIATKKYNKETGEEVINYRKWTESSIRTILNNKIYIGIHEFRKSVANKEIIEIKNAAPSIISEELFYECQENIKRNMKNYYRAKKYLFMQRMTCHKCGRIMACDGVKNNLGKTYLYYKCKDCDNRIREDLIEKEVIKKLSNLLELYLVLENNYIPVDSESAKLLKNGKIDNNIRYALDVMNIENKLNNSNYNFLVNLWNNIDYEIKCRFIYEYIDTITIKQYKNNNKDVKVKILDMKLRKNEIAKFFELKEKNAIDEASINFENNSIKTCTFNSKEKADNYIELLRNKYNINVIDSLENRDYCLNENIFRIINVDSKRVVEKNRTLFLELRP